MINETDKISKYKFSLSKASNEALEDALVKVKTIYEHTGNMVVKQLMTSALEELSREIVKRDSSLISKLSNLIYVFKYNNFLFNKRRNNTTDGI